MDFSILLLQLISFQINLIILNLAYYVEIIICFKSQIKACQENMDLPLLIIYKELIFIKVFYNKNLFSLLLFL